MTIGATTYFWTGLVALLFSGLKLYPSDELASFLPNENSIPIGVTKYDNGQLHVTVPPPPSSRTKPSPKNAITWPVFVAEQDSWVQELIQNTFYDNIIDVIASIQEAPAVSDGSASEPYYDIWLNYSTGQW